MGAKRGFSASNGRDRDLYVIIRFIAWQVFTRAEASLALWRFQTAA